MTIRSEAWTLFDAIVDQAPERDTNPWRLDDRHERAFHPDYETLAKLLAVPVALKANSQSGVPALALDVWTAYEFRRAGFDPDTLWPRASAPRVLPAEIANLLEALPATIRGPLAKRIEAGGLKGTVGANATILGKNYVKQVDVGMSSWRTGPELLVSTKRMDSSFGKNAANRVEESYGDAKNLRLRHPQAALGFMYGLRSTALEQEPDKTDWLRDLLIKLGREDDAYDAVALVVPEWTEDGEPAATEENPEDDDALVAAGLAATEIEDAELPLGLPEEAIKERIADLPIVKLRHDAVPDELRPDRFFALMTHRILDNCPVNFHTGARRRLSNTDAVRS